MIRPSQSPPFFDLRWLEGLRPAAQQLSRAFPRSLILLAGLSALAVGMLAGRALMSGRTHYFFLLWNLFLAWLPLPLAWAAYGLQRYPLAAVVPAGLWLLFLPNAPYLITDLMHLRPAAGIPIWYDAYMLFAFAVCGLLLGLRSLALMERVVQEWAGTAGSRLFVLAACGLSGVGVYLGRFLRWNSWDVFGDPLALAAELVHHLATPQLLARAVIVVVVFTAFTAGTYWLGLGRES
jgi:uncharacterized membrane protein